VASASGGGAPSGTSSPSGTSPSGSSPSSSSSSTTSEPVGNLHRQRLDVHLTRDLAEDAALLDPRRLADELDDDLSVDGLIEPHFLEIDVEEPGPGRVELVLLEDGVMGLLRALEDDVEDRVQAVVAGEHAPELALLDAELVRLAAVAVEDAGDEPVRAQAARGGASARLPGLHLEPDAIAGHPAGKCSEAPPSAFGRAEAVRARKCRVFIGRGRVRPARSSKCQEVSGCRRRVQ
jgi:hypothetical protein